MKERFDRLGIRSFVPFFALVGCALVTLVLHFIIGDEHVAMNFLALAVSPFVGLLFPLYTLCFGKRLPLTVVILICAHVLCACEIGTVLRVYDRLPWWDLFAHGFFGFNACLTVFVLLANHKDVRLHPAWLLVLAFCVSMALGAVWEIMEYATDCLTGSDVQRVADSIAAGKSPVADTMEDLIITAIGVAVFAVWFAADALCSHKSFVYLRLLPPAEKHDPLADNVASADSSSTDRSSDTDRNAHSE